MINILGHEKILERKRRIVKLFSGKGGGGQKVFAKELCKQGEREVECSPEFEVRCQDKQNYRPAEQKSGRKVMLWEEISTINCFIKHPVPLEHTGLIWCAGGLI